MYQHIIKFWFEETDESKWWVEDPEFDQLIRQRFSQIHTQAIHCELHHWRATPLGRLAEIIVLDQFSRNMFRGSPRAFAADALALALSQEAVAAHVDSQLDEKQRSFLYMPYMHSESAKIHEIAVSLFEQSGSQSNLDFELRHKAIIDRFGRYPHRNQILSRTSTDEEIAFLQEPGSGF